MDLAEFSSVVAFVDRALKELERIDILLLNAAVALGTPQYKATIDGWEQSFVDHTLHLRAPMVITVIWNLGFK